jgi:hypothetical protein
MRLHSPTYSATDPERFFLKVRDETVGIAVGAENWVRANDFLRIPTGLPEWFTESVWDSLLAARRQLDVQPSLRDLAKGVSGFGGEE